jgi:hypothetical protein
MLVLLSGLARTARAGSHIIRAFPCTSLKYEQTDVSKGSTCTLENMTTPENTTSPPMPGTEPNPASSGVSSNHEGVGTPDSGQVSTVRILLWKLYLSHTLSTWNARTFEFGAVIFLAAIFPGTLFYASCYALFRSLSAFLFSTSIGSVVDTKERLWVVRQSILWQRIAVASSCLTLILLLKETQSKAVNVLWFSLCVVLACIEKLAFVGNTVAVERDWAVVISDSLSLPREDLNSAMKRIDLICKLVAPLIISLIDGFSTKVAIWVVFGQNAASFIIVSRNPESKASTSREAK